MITQTSFLETGWKPVIPADPNLDDAERKRLGPDCLAVLNRLRMGPATNGDLIPITARYGGRIYDLRKAGCVISKARVSAGTWRYTLEYEPAGLA